jgi:hypothetical protein
MTAKLGYIGVLIALAMSAGAPAARAQCCGDCDGDGAITIDELVGTVGRALAGCSAASQPMLVTRGVSFPYLAGTLAADIVEGRVDLTLDTAWGGGDPGDRVLFKIVAPATSPDGIEVIQNDAFLRLVVADDSGFERDISLRIDAWHPGLHTVSVRWGAGTLTFAIDGGPAVNANLDSVRLAAGSDVRVGAVDAPGTTFREIVFVGTPPS